MLKLLQPMEKYTLPNYKKIYTDILEMKFPAKKSSCKSLLEKEKLSVLDVIKLNAMIFKRSSREDLRYNQKLRSYTSDDIAVILEFQEKNNLNNSQVARHFKMSRNTIAKWRQMFGNDDCSAIV